MGYEAIGPKSRTMIGADPKPEPTAQQIANPPAKKKLPDWLKWGLYGGAGVLGYTLLKKVL
jgi:hypothetical protein